MKKGFCHPSSIRLLSRSLIMVFVTALVNCSLLSLTVTFAAAEDRAHQAVNGKDVRDREYPWISLIQDKQDGSFVCTAAFIGTRFLVTARHCFQHFEPKKYKALVGFLCTADDNCNRESVEVPVKNLFPNKSGGDMTIVELADDVSDSITPAVPYVGKKLNKKQRDVKKKQKLTIVTAGRDGYRGDLVERATKIRTKVISKKTCKKGIAPENLDILLTETTVCSKPIRGMPCEGDSGSALVADGKGKWKGRDVIMAIHSWGPRNCNLFVSDPIAVGHFLMSKGSSFLMDVVCNSFSPPEWCQKSTKDPNDRTSEPTSSPKEKDPTTTPTHKPAVDPDADPASKPTRHPTRRRTSRPTLEPIVQGTNRPKIRPTNKPTSEPTASPTQKDPTTPPTYIHTTSKATKNPTRRRTNRPTSERFVQPTNRPKVWPTNKPTLQPTNKPTFQPTDKPTFYPTNKPTIHPTNKPTFHPTNKPTFHPTNKPTFQPTNKPTLQPTEKPTLQPTNKPTIQPTAKPTLPPTENPTQPPTRKPTLPPTSKPTFQPTIDPTAKPTFYPTAKPTIQPTKRPTFKPSIHPSTKPTSPPTFLPTTVPTTPKPTLPPSPVPTTKKPTVGPSFVPTQFPTTTPPALTVTLIHALVEHTDWIRSVAFNPEGTRAASLDIQGTIKIWNPLAGGAAISTFTGYSQAQHVKWDPSGTYVALNGPDSQGSLKLLNVDSPEQSISARLDSSDANVLAWHPDGDQLAAAYYSSSATTSDDVFKIMIWNKQSGEIRAIFEQSCRVETMEFRPDGNQLAIGCSDFRDPRVILWDPATSQAIRTLQHSRQIRSLSYSKNGEFLVVAENFGAVKLWDIRTGNLWHELQDVYQSHVGNLVWSPDNGFLAMGRGDDDVVIWEPSQTTPIFEWKAHSSQTACSVSVDWSSDRKHLVSGACDNVVKIWLMQGTF